MDPVDWISLAVDLSLGQETWGLLRLPGVLVRLSGGLGGVPGKAALGEVFLKTDLLEELLCLQMHDTL